MARLKTTAPFPPCQRPDAGGRSVRHLAATIRDRCAHYVMSLKDNQPALHANRAMLLDEASSTASTAYRNVLDWLGANDAAAVKRPVVIIDLGRDGSVVAYNILRRRDQASRSVVIDALVEAIAHVWGAANTTATPLFARWASNLLTLLYENRLTLAEAAALLDDFPLRQSLTQGLEDGGMAQRDWAAADRLNPKDFEAQVGSTFNAQNIYGVPTPT